MQFSSKLIETAVAAFSSLPGIGRKTALRLVLHLVQQPGAVTTEFVQALDKMRAGIRECEICHNLSDEVRCMVCRDERRNKQLICVVESIRDVMAIEETGQYQGQYHVLGGVISPIEGIGPQELNIESLIARASQEEVQEIIMAISPTIEGETTIYYLTRQIQDSGVRISTIARGVSFGGELEYADGVTLGRSIVARTPYKLD
ncbi:MAG: recombination protein RecR [Bacteroidetes bacterium]|nr:MAG: recombination protein RecR [Bacteroidota bacterium]PTM13851.1 MAG: recombination protein RecR [Bacteroidota bacterium]